jgi:hypothetical protein
MRIIDVLIAETRRYNHPLKRYPRHLLLQQKMSKQGTRIDCSFLAAPKRPAGSAFPYARIPLFRLFYQVEIRHLPIPSSEIPSQLTAADARHSKRDCGDCGVLTYKLLDCLRFDGRPDGMELAPIAERWRLPPDIGSARSRRCC